MPVEHDLHFRTSALNACPRDPGKPRAGRRGAIRAFSLFLRRSHMYVALFLTPWMTMYALSTLAFNHFEHLAHFYGGQMDRFEKERDLAYNRTFAPGTLPYAKAEQILRDLNLSGSLRLNRGPEDRLIVTRMDPVTPRRITYIPAEGKLLVEKQVFRTPGFLTRLHSRVGYGSKYKLVNVWAFSVDLSIFATLLWIVSGLWMWWELKTTRGWGIVFAVLGLVLFGTFLIVA